MNPAKAMADSRERSPKSLPTAVALGSGLVAKVKNGIMEPAAAICATPWAADSTATAPSRPPPKRRASDRVRRISRERSRRRGCNDPS
jgi:hypothetical protein